MEIVNRSDSAPFVTKDGSTIRSLLDRTNSSAANQSLAEATVPPGGATEPHRHPQTEEIYYILSGSGRITVGEDKAYDSRDHVTALRRMNVTPHVAQNDALTKTGRRRTSAIDKRTTRHVGYRISQSCRAMVECIFGWGKQHGTMRKTKHRGIAAVGGDFMLNLIAYNLVRIPKLVAA